jgi:hypothetical protein
MLSTAVSLGFIPFLALLLSQTCAATAAVTVQVDSPEVKTKTIQGRLRIFEGSYFRTSDGRVFDLQITSHKDQTRLARLSKITKDDQEVCLSLSLKGQESTARGMTARATFAVTRILRASRIKCDFT